MASVLFVCKSTVQECTAIIYIIEHQWCNSIIPMNSGTKTFSNFAFSALTLLVWRQKEHLVCKNPVMGCWCGYLSGAKFRLFVQTFADATAIPKPHNLLPHLNLNWFYLSGTGLPRLPWKRLLNGCSRPNSKSSSLVRRQYY